MRLFLLEAYGSAYRSLQHFTVRADTLEAAIDFVRRSTNGEDYGHFDLIEESDEFPAVTTAIIETGEGAYLEHPYVPGLEAPNAALHR